MMGPFVVCVALSSEMRNSARHGRVFTRIEAGAEWGATLLKPGPDAADM